MFPGPNGAPAGYRDPTQATDPLGGYSGAGGSAPTLAAAGAYIPVIGATWAAEIADPAGTYGPASASAPTTDPAGAYSLAGAGTSAPMLAPPGAYIPVAGATSAEAEIPDPAGAYSAAGASASTLAATGAYVPVTAATSGAADIVAPPGTYLPAGASAPMADPGGTYSAAGASAPTKDPAGTYSSPYALDRLFPVISNNVPVGAVLSFSSVTAVENYFGATTEEARLAREFFAGYAGTSATMLFTRYPYDGGRSRVYSANLSDLTKSQLHSIEGSLSLTLNGNTYTGSVNLSNVPGRVAAAAAIAHRVVQFSGL